MFMFLFVLPELKLSASNNSRALNFGIITIEHRQARGPTILAGKTTFHFKSPLANLFASGRDFPLQRLYVLIYKTPSTNLFVYLYCVASPLR